MCVCLAAPVLSFGFTPIPHAKSPVMKMYWGCSSPEIRRAFALRAFHSESEDTKSKDSREVRAQAEWLSLTKIDSVYANYMIEKLFTGGTTPQFTFLLFVATIFVSGGALLLWLAAFGENTLQFALSKSYMLLFRYELLPAMRCLYMLKAAAGFLATARWPLRHPWSP